MQVYHLSSTGTKTYLARGIYAPGGPELPNFSRFGAQFGVQAVAFCRAAFIEARDYGNDTHTTAFTVERCHADLETALEFYFQHAMTMRAIKLGTFVFIAEIGTRQRLFYLKKAGLQSIEFPEPDGITTECTYTLLGGSMDTTP